MAPREWLVRREGSAHKGHREWLDPREWQGQRVLWARLAPLGCKALLACKDRGCRAFRANKEWLALQVSQAPSGLQANRECRARLVLIVVVQDQVVVAQ